MYSECDTCAMQCQQLLSGIALCLITLNSMEMSLFCFNELEGQIGIGDNLIRFFHLGFESSGFRWLNSIIYSTFFVAQSHYLCSIFHFFHSFQFVLFLLLFLSLFAFGWKWNDSSAITLKMFGNFHSYWGWDQIEMEWRTKRESKMAFLTRSERLHTQIRLFVSCSL